MPQTASISHRFTSAQRVVVKIGSGALLGETPACAARVAATLDRVLAADRDVLLVSSGATGLGRRLLGTGDKPIDAEMARACAAAGQSRLAGVWQRALERHGRVAAQVLLTEEDFDERPRCLELRATLARLLQVGAVPLLNENDAVVHGAYGRSRPGVRAVFVDNDRLAALVAAELDADLLVLATDVDGVSDRDPRRDPTARRFRRLEADEAARLATTFAGSEPGPAGRGGMASKLEAACLAARAGCHAVIAHLDDLATALDGGDVGTWIPPVDAPPARRRWIAWAAAPRGTLVLDDGAVRALRERRASLLPVGVIDVRGDFAVGDVVELRDERGELVGRGRMPHAAASVRRWCRLRVAPRSATHHGAGQRPRSGSSCLLRRDDVVLTT